jgi:hypothetical protein
VTEEEDDERTSPSWFSIWPVFTQEFSSLCRIIVICSQEKLFVDMLLCRQLQKMRKRSMHGWRAQFG